MDAEEWSEAEGVCAYCGEQVDDSPTTPGSDPFDSGIPDDGTRELIDAANEAQEKFPLDELEEFARRGRNAQAAVDRILEEHDERHDLD